MSAVKCPMCFTGICKKHPNQDSGAAILALGPTDRAATLKKMFDEMIGKTLEKERGARTLEKAAARDELMARVSAPRRGWGVHAGQLGVVSRARAAGVGGGAGALRQRVPLVYVRTCLRLREAAAVLRRCCVLQSAWGFFQCVVFVCCDRVSVTVCQPVPACASMRCLASHGVACLFMCTGWVARLRGSLPFWNAYAFRM
jgi:hypothetical protein